MPDKILIATQNHDKFEAVRGMFAAIGCNTFDFDYFGSIGLHDAEVDETGSILDRAEQKARYAIERIGKETSTICVIGIDDGVLIKDKMIENVKTVLPQILSGSLLSSGEVIYVCRAFYALAKKDKCCAITTKIPFEYHQTTDLIKTDDRSYPLSRTLTPLGRNEFIADMSDTEVQAYYALHCATDIQRLAHSMGMLG